MHSLSGIKILNWLPSWCRFVGGAFMLFGLFATYYFVYLSVKPDWLQLNVFTVYSQYLETTTFSFINNNQGDEMAISIYLVGFLIFLFSSNKNQSETNTLLKVKALVNTVILSISLFVVAYFFIHGMVVLYLVVLFSYSFPLIYVFIFYLLRIAKFYSFEKERKKD
ncbi:MAG: hypothetical protein PHN40_09930 [Dysgonamonadaceae bacterium]|nr:hypothetical protein [Dysgonamonadaceae bacterium]